MTQLLTIRIIRKILHNTINSADRSQSLKISRLCKSEIEYNLIMNYNNIIYDTIIRQINLCVDFSTKHARIL